MIRRDPEIDISSASFAHFVLDAEPPEVISDWEAVTADSLWASLRLPLGLVLVMAVHDADHGLRRCFHDIRGNTCALVAAGADGGAYRGATLGVTATGNRIDLEFLHPQLLVNDGPDRINDGVHRAVTPARVDARGLPVES